jgi:hypothetical protein
MSAPIAHHLLAQLPLSRAVAATALLTLVLGLAGCAGSVSEMGDNMTLAFVDPAKYDYYDCKQLEAERKSIANHIEELQRLMAKADTGAAGPVVAELAYRQDYISYRGQAKLADETWRRNNCHDSPPAPPGAAAAAAPPAPPAHAKGGRSPQRSGNAVN